MSCTHLDLTTLIGAGRALDEDRLQNEGLQLSNLLSLSQFIEALVLHQELQYEVQDSPEFHIYVEQMLRSPVGLVISEGDVPIRPAISSYESDEDQVTRAVLSAASLISEIPPASLLHAARWRAGIYRGIGGADDNYHPFLRHYLDVARGSLELGDWKKVQTALASPNLRDAGPLGFHVAVRVQLLTAWLASEGRTYAPHFSRQGVLAGRSAANDRVQPWTMDRLRRLRSDVLEELAEDRDQVAEILSPIFLACLANSRHPRDLIEEAYKLRNSSAAASYRSELSAMFKTCSGNVGTTRMYRKRIQERMRGLNDFLFENGSKEEKRRTTTLRSSLSTPLEWTYAIVSTRATDRYPGDRAILFLSNVLKSSLGIDTASVQIKDVFGVECAYDTDLIGLEPDGFRF